MAVQFVCPKCNQKATLTSSKPGDWIECPGCDATVQIPIAGAAPKSQAAATPRPAPSGATARPAPRPAARPAPAPEPLDLEDEPKSLWSDKRVQVAAIGGGLTLLVVALVAVMLLVQKPKKQPEVVQNQPQSTATQPATTPKPPEPAPKPKTEPKVEPKIEPKNEPKVEPKLPPKPIALDQFGNPIDQNAGLAQQDEFKGQRILFWSAWVSGEAGGPEVLFGAPNPLWKALKDVGFSVRREFGKFDPEWLKEADQFWIVSGTRAGRLTPADFDAIEEFVKSGKGLCLLSDNVPAIIESDELAKRLFGVRVEGNYYATKIAYVRNRNLSAEDIKKYKGDYAVDDHPLLTGVNFVYEGVTISNVESSDDLEVALKASDGKPVVVVSKDPKKRVVIDCGFTRYWHHPTDSGANFIEKTAGTPRLGQNMAAYLAGKGAPKKP